MIVTLLPLLFLALQAQADASPTFGQETMRIPLSRRAIRLTLSDGKANMTAIRQEANRVNVKYQRNRNNILAATGSDRMIKSRGMTSLAVPADLTWTGAVKIGTPPQLFNVMFDTGSTDFTVGDSSCSNCGTKAKYTLASSSTGSDTAKTASAYYGDGSSTLGKVYTDTVEVAGITVPSQSFIAATKMATTITLRSVDGLMGMAFTPLSSTGTQGVPFHMSQLGFGNYFAIALRNTAAESFVTFGNVMRRGVVRGQTKTTQTIPVKPDSTSGFYTYWQAGNAAPIVNGAQALATRVNHIIDTGAVLISAPTSSAAEFWSHVPGSAPFADQPGFYTYPCTSTVQVAFSLGSGANLNINMADFNLGYIDAAKTRCVGGIIGQSLGIGSSWLLGEVFIKNYYVVFDMKNTAMTFVSN